jgi:hypothetical protein
MYTVFSKGIRLDIDTKEEVCEIRGRQFFDIVTLSDINGNRIELLKCISNGTLDKKYKDLVKILIDIL